VIVIKKRRLPKWDHIFNAIIENWYLKEEESDVRIFTWSNKNEDPTLCRLDRIFDVHEF
jgi:hypothetical protein